ncbi:MAG: carbohydrate porin [Capsulimonadaceae bacterium]|nr:carbohydrate porin [Capsulimonadaceae bacterium]
MIGNQALATPPPISAPPTDTSTSETGQPAAAQPSKSPGFFEGLSRRSYFLGDIWGLRKELSKHGMTLDIVETSELLGNLTGGVQKGFEYDGLTQVDLQLDTQRALRHYGGTLNVSALQIHGNNLSALNLGTLQTASGIEADRSTRLWELWYQQKYLPEDRLDIKIGQQSLDQEFMVSQNAGVFVNTMFGWAMAPSADLPGGGPAYPLSALGVRARIRPAGSTTVLAGVFNGSPVSRYSGDPQLEDGNGLKFPLNGGTLAIAEVQTLYPALGGMVYDGSSGLLSHTYKLGAYYDTESFADEQDAARQHRGNYGLYGVVDQMIWLSEEDPDRSWSFFARAMSQPQSDRNLIDYSMNAGFVLHDPFPHIQRDDDTFGIGMGFAYVSSGAAALDRDSGLPERSSETFVEMTYQYQYTPWCQIQPDIQYVFNPGGGILNPNGSGERVHDETVVGMRMNILF